MNEKPKIYKRENLQKVAQKIRDDVAPQNNIDFVLLYAYNGTGKTVLSMEFKNIGKKKRKGKVNRDTLYFNAFTEDLFHWENDLENDTERYLKMNSDSKFFSGLKELALEVKIEKYFHRYTDINFRIDYENWSIHFSKIDHTANASQVDRTPTDTEPCAYTCEDIKISRGEENIFIWCLFLAFCELAIDGDETYDWVKYIYIDDPISSLDENNAIRVAVDLVRLLKKGTGRIKYIISSHHTLFFNVLCNEVSKSKRYFLTYSKDEEKYFLRSTCDTPFFHHVAMVTELKKAVDTGNIYTYHFNILRSLLEKASNFHGFDHFSACIKKDENDPDGMLYNRIIQLLSHGGYSIFEPKEMMPENKKHFENILNVFLEYYPFNRELFNDAEQVETP